MDFKKLEELFKYAVLPVVAVHGVGVHQLLEEAIELVMYHHPHAHYVEGGKEIHEALTHDKKVEEARKTLKDDRSLKKNLSTPRFI